MLILLATRLWTHLMSKVRLHLDADTSIKALQTSLQSRGHDVTRTPNSWMPLDASDTDQLLGATSQGRCIFTFNARDFVPLSRIYPGHGGIVLSRQGWPLAAQTDRVPVLSRVCSGSA